jgi:hypothetical protein
MFVIPAVVLTVTPTSGAAGTQVTITGTGFGASQGTIMVWLGSTKANVVSWSDTQIVATGTAQVSRSGVWSNSIPFTVASPTITSVSPETGNVGTTVTIAGSGFGATQGTGQVWIGTAQGVVQSWSATQIVAQVAAGSKSGVVQVLNNGAASGVVEFIVNSLNLVSVSPDTAGAGTTVTLAGTGFGATQGTGQVRLGSAAGTVVNWSDTAITATVASGSISGVARVQVSNGELSNALAFKITGGSGGTVSMIAPSILNMLVGDSRSLQAVSSTGQTVTGLAWSSSNTAVVSLSTDDPPVLSALAPGRVTISAGGASADVVVMAGDQFPVGTTAWSTPVGVGRIMPAVPSATGVADVFVASAQSVSALTSEGVVAWTTALAVPPDKWWTIEHIPDFQGGMIVQHSGTTIQRLNGMTGALTTLYTAGADTQVYGIAIHPDGTIFATTQGPGPGSSSLTLLVGIDSATGGVKFSVPVDTSATGVSFLARPIIAGDGNGYLPFATRVPCEGNCASNQLSLLRVSSAGAATTIGVTGWRSSFGDAVPVSVAPLITNKDTGVLMSFSTRTTDGSESTPWLATTTGTNVSLISPPFGLSPRLQAEDGSFVGVANIGGNSFMVAFDANGGIRWAVRGQSPRVVLADGEVITETGIKYANGQALNRGVGANSVYSWTWNSYTMASFGAVARITMPPLILAQSWWPWGGGNASKNNTAAPDKYVPLESNESRRSTNSTCNGPTGICPQEAILAALKAVKAIFNAPSCSACDTYVHSKIPSLTRDKMREFLSRSPRFWDVTRSSVLTQDAFCASGMLARFNCPITRNITVAQYAVIHWTGRAFAQTPVNQGEGLQVFFNPRLGVCNVLPVATPGAGDKGVLNQALLLHESLHNWTGKADNGTTGLMRTLGLQDGDSDEITFHFRKNVIPGGLPGATECQ